MGGGGLYGTARDYLAFTQMILQGGSLKGALVLRPETVDLMAQNHIAPLDIPAMKTAIPALSNDVEHRPFVTDDVIQTDYDPSRMQDLLFIIPSFAFLRREIEQLVKRFGIPVL